ncbi:putative F-box domain-containing protein [Tanacetum coccineum]
MKPKPKRSTMEVHVPHDVILNHILPRIPAKSVCRFKCVSKEWHSFLTSDMFQNKHNRHVDDHKNNLKLLVLSKTEKSLEFATIDCEAPLSDKGLTPTRRSLPPFEDSTTPYHIDILTSFHGLGLHHVFIGNSRIWYYSRCEDDCKLLFVNFTDDNVYIYSLRWDSWRKVDGFQQTSRLYPGSRSQEMLATFNTFDSGATTRASKTAFSNLEYSEKQLG